MRPGFWRNCRVCFRWCRIIGWLLLLAVVCAVLWLNRIGLPDFLKSRLVTTLHERGVALEFSRMRLRFERGIVAENVRIGGAQTGASPVLTLAEVHLQLDFVAMLRGRLQVDGLVLRQGKFTWSFSPTNTLRLDDIQTTLRFRTNDTWSLDNFQAGLAGAKFAMSGEIIHAPEMSSWEMFHGGSATNATAWQTQLQELSDTVNRFHFDGTPQLSLTVNGDARDPKSFSVHFIVQAAGAQTPWFQVHDLQLSANLTASAGTSANLDASCSFWTNLLPYKLVWFVHGASFRSEKLNLDSITFGGYWRAPEITVTSLSFQLGGGRLEAQAGLNVATRMLSFTNSSCFDLRAIKGLLPKKTVERLADFSWTAPPSLFVGGSLIFPAWTNAQPDWLGEVGPTLRLNGEFAVTNAIVAGGRIDSLVTHFSYLDQVWQLPDLKVARAKTRLAINGFEDDATKKYHVQLCGVVDPEVARPFLTRSNAARGLEIVKLPHPLAVDLDVTGRLHDLDSIAANGFLAATNFAVRGEQFGDVTAAINYSNRQLAFLHPVTHTGDQMAEADSVTLDFKAGLILFTNVFSTADPYPVARAIGPKTGKLVSPYHFLRPPTVQLNGQIPLGGINGGSEMTNINMCFDFIRGAPFEWLKLKTTNIVGTLVWRGQTLLLTNVTAAFYDGKASGFAYFDFCVPHEGGDYQYAVSMSDVNLHLLSTDLSSPTNRLEGIFNGEIVVTNATTENWRTLSGHGHVHLRDGLLWDIPVFGILSPVLNTVSPGLGNSRATEAKANFAVARGLISTDSLEIRSTMTRLEYVGTIDLQQNVNAHVTAQLLRDTPMVGPVVSTVLWPVSKLFEYRVTGTLNNPRSEPIFVLPKLLMIPLHPIKTLEDIIIPSSGPSLDALPGK